MQRGSHGWEAGRYNASGHFYGSPANGRSECISGIQSIVGKQNSKAVGGCEDDAMLVVRF